MPSNEVQALNRHSIDHVAFRPSVTFLVAETLGHGHAPDRDMVGAYDIGRRHADRDDVHKRGTPIHLLVKDDDGPLLNHLAMQVLLRELAHEDFARPGVIKQSHDDCPKVDGHTLPKPSGIAMDKSVDNLGVLDVVYDDPGSSPKAE